MSVQIRQGTEGCQHCQVHKARNITERLPKSLHASVRRALRQAWELDDADKAEKLIRNLARRLEREAPGVSASILEGIDKILTVTRLRLPTELRRSLACTNIIENMNGTIRRICRNVKRWRDAATIRPSPPRSTPPSSRATTASTSSSGRDDRPTGAPLPARRPPPTPIDSQIGGTWSATSQKAEHIAGSASPRSGRLLGERNRVLSVRMIWKTLK